MNPNPLIPRLSAKDNPIHFQAKFSKWIALDCLIDENEMKDLFENLQPVFILTMQNLSNTAPFLFEIDDFLKGYANYISLLKKGCIPAFKDFKKLFYHFLSSSLNEIYIRKIGEEKEALVINSPLIEVKPICLTISNVDQSIRAMPVNPSGILWGLRFAFAQIMQKGGSHNIEQIDFQKHPNGLLFKKLRTWIRNSTQATPFIIGQKRVRLPIRLGKECFKWINDHPQLKDNLAIEKNSL